MQCIVKLSVICFLAGPTFAQSNVNASHKNAWCENIGWTNWRDAGNPEGEQGLAIHLTYLSGFVWAENVGWINLGDGDPGAPGGVEVHYGNATGADFGVNLDAETGELFGLAWGENIGWINFEGGALTNPPKAARIDGDRLRGFLWSENIGWINLDDETHYIAFVLPCNPCDTNCDGSVNQFDIQPFVQAVLTHETPCGSCAGDTNSDGSINQFDVQVFVECLSG